MRIINADLLKAAGLNPCQTSFVELWYEMTHLHSLDSYRVKCLNSHTILHELNEELRIGLVNEEEIDVLCAEANEILKNDTIINTHFATQLRVIQPLLSKPPKGEKKTRNESKQWQQLRFVTHDFLVALDSKYFTYLCDAITSAIKPDNEDRIRQLVSALLSELVGRGWPLETLFRWHRHFLKQKAKQTYSFDQNLDFMLRQFKREPQSFHVTLHLSGSKKLFGITTFHGFRLTEEFSLSAHEKTKVRGGPPDKFLRPYENILFATTDVNAWDSGSAAIQARTKIEYLLDLVRFDFETQVVKVGPRCLVRRQGDGHVELLEIPQAVPNPRLPRALDDFKVLVESVDKVLERTNIDEISRQQLQASIRQYRFGSDAESYGDKFTAWWTGLEALTNLSQGKTIGFNVMFNTSRTMLCNYMYRLLSDLLETLKHLKISWLPELAGCSGCPDIESLTVSKLLQILESSFDANKLWNLCTQHPVLVYFGKQLQDVVSNPSKLYDKLKEHRRHLEWQLNRLYRIRCCLVHGTPIQFNLALYAANLEFYLKEIILFVLTALKDNKHIRSLDEVFHRASTCYDRKKAFLKDPQNGANAIHEAVCMDIVVR